MVQSKNFNDLASQASEECKRLTMEVVENQASGLEMGADSSLQNFFEGNMFAAARHLDIEINAPFDEMDADEAFALVDPSLA